MKTEEPHAETTTEGQLPAGEPAKAEPTTTTPAKQVEAPAASPPAASPDLSGELAVARKLIAELEGKVSSQGEEIKGLKGLVTAAKAVAHETEVLARVGRGAAGSPEALRGLYREIKGTKFEANEDPAKEAAAALEAMKKIEPALFEAARNTNMSWPRSAELQPRRQQQGRRNPVVG